jgi:putative ribosome biogenesis GTPase RsgA
MNTIKTVQDFKNFVGSNGKFFSVTFKKENGDTRKMVARLGVHKYTSGRGMLYNAEAVNNIIVFSTKDNGYRTIKIDRLLSVKANKQIITL